MQRGGGSVVAPWYFSKACGCCVRVCLHPQISQRPKFQSPRHEEVDYVLVGAGMSGVFMLAEALQQGFKSVVVIDRKDR